MRPNKLNIFHFFNKSLVGYLFFLHRFFWTMREKKEVLWFFSAFIVFARQNTSVRRNTLLTYSAVCFCWCCCCCCCLLLFMLQIDDFGSIFLVFFVSLSHFIHFIWAFSCILLYTQAEKLFICECTLYTRSKREKKIGRIFALRKKVFKFALLFRSLHTVSPLNTQLCSNFMSIRVCCFVFTCERYWCFGSFNNKLIECCWWVHNNNRNTLPIQLVLSSAWCIFPFF